MCSAAQRSEVDDDNDKTLCRKDGENGQVFRRYRCSKSGGYVEVTCRGEDCSRYGQQRKMHVQRTVKVDRRR